MTAPRTPHEQISPAVGAPAAGGRPVETTEPDDTRTIIARVLSSRGSAFCAFAVVLWLAAQLLGRASTPAPALIAGLFGGLAVRSLAPRLLKASRARSGWSQGLVGVMLGTFFDIPALISLGRTLVPFLLVSVATLAMSVAIAAALARATAIDRAGSSLGMATDEPIGGEDTGAAGLIQHVRLLFIACAAPLVLVVLSAAPDICPARHLWNGEQPYLVPRGDQIAGVSIAFVLAGIGPALARQLRLPSPEILGPMALSTIVTETGISHGFAPAGIFLDALMVVIGLEASTRFDRAVLGKAAKLMLFILVGAFTLSLATAALAAGVGGLFEIALPDAYLATVPGGFALVSAIADPERSNLPLIASTHVLRLVVMAVAVPAAVRYLRPLEPSNRRLPTV